MFVFESKSHSPSRAILLKDHDHAKGRRLFQVTCGHWMDFSLPESTLSKVMLLDVTWTGCSVRSHLLCSRDATPQSFEVGPWIDCHCIETSPMDSFQWFCGESWFPCVGRFSFFFGLPSDIQRYYRLYPCKSSANCSSFVFPLRLISLCVRSTGLSFSPSFFRQMTVASSHGVISQA